MYQRNKINFQGCCTKHVHHVNNLTFGQKILVKLNKFVPMTGVYLQDKRVYSKRTVTCHIMKDYIRQK